MKKFSNACLVSALLAVMSQGAAAQSPASFPSAADSDPAKTGIMQGSPPPVDKIVRFGDGTSSRFPAMRWSLNHIRELGATVNVWRGEGAPFQFPRAPRDLDAIPITTLDGKQITFADVPALTYTDGLLVLHKGAIVYEKYFGAGAAHRPHIAFSVTKSVVGTLAAALAAKGKLDTDAPVTQYVPELAKSAYGDATVRQVLDMTIGLKFSENYADPKADAYDYARASGTIPIPPGYTGPKTSNEYLVQLQKEGEHGDAFGYKTPNTAVLAWVLRRASGTTLAELLSSEIWQKLGAEEDAYFTIDSIGTESGGGGLNTTLRDLARFGEMIRNNGRFNGQQIIPAEAVADIRKSGDPTKFAKGGYPLLKGWAYRNMWWMTNNANGAFVARGIFGQAIYVDPKAEMVVVRYASHPIAGNSGNDPVTLPTYEALAKALGQ